MLFQQLSGVFLEGFLSAIVGNEKGKVPPPAEKLIISNNVVMHNVIYPKKENLKGL